MARTATFRAHGPGLFRERVGEGALPYARRTGDPHDERGASGREDRLEDGATLGQAVLHRGQRARECPRVASTEARDEGIDIQGQRIPARSPVSNCLAITMRWISDVPSPIVVSFASR